jgi:hypothetical protein
MGDLTWIHDHSTSAIQERIEGARKRGMYQVSISRAECRYLSRITGGLFSTMIRPVRETSQKLRISRAGKARERKERTRLNSRLITIQPRANELQEKHVTHISVVNGYACRELPNEEALTTLLASIATAPKKYVQWANRFADAVRASRGQPFKLFVR